MPGLELSTQFDPRIDQMSKKIQEIRERNNAKVDATMDGALNAVEQNLGRKQADEASLSLQGLGAELTAQKEALHGLDPMRVADLISDPFDD